MLEHPVLMHHFKRYGGEVVHSALNQLPVENHRLLAHRANVVLPRGADSRHRLQNRVEQIRHMGANAKIIVDRALG